MNLFKQIYNKITFSSSSFAAKSAIIMNKAIKLKVVNWTRINKNHLFAIIDSHIIHYPAPLCLTYAWSFGSLAGLSLVIQIVSGLLLSTHYTANINLAFYSVEYIMRDVNNGWLVRYTHANGASMFFMVVYAHICRGLYYGSYMAPREALWCSGVVLFFLLMGAAFTGYVLPWGQMSFWGATVITNMVTILPGGTTIVEWLWGGYTIKDPTLRRFYTLHFLLPFVIAGMTVLHLTLLHQVGSTSPIGSDTGIDDVPFYPYFVLKDLFAFTIYLLVFTIFVYYFPNFLNHPDNCIPADPFETPKHVVPEWYFLPFYAMLRSIPHKTGGILCMFGSIAVLFVIPFINTSRVRNTTYRPIFKFFFWVFVGDFVFLTWLGQKPVKDWYAQIGRYATVLYFAFFLIFLPASGKLEHFLATYGLERKKKEKRVRKINSD